MYLGHDKKSWLGKAVDGLRARQRRRELVLLAELVQIEADARSGAIVENSHNSRDIGFPISEDRHPVVAFMLMRMQRADGHELDVDLLYPAYLAWHGGGAGTGEPLAAEPFADALAYIFRRAHIRTRQDGDRVFCLGVRLV